MSPRQANTLIKMLNHLQQKVKEGVDTNQYFLELKEFVDLMVPESQRQVWFAFGLVCSLVPTHEVSNYDSDDPIEVAKVVHEWLTARLSKHPRCQEDPDTSLVILDWKRNERTARN